MRVVITKLSDVEHKIEVTRNDESTESTILNSRSFLMHDFAHFAVESEVPIKLGYWGLVASGASLSGASLSGEEISGNDIALTESLAGPIQTLMRVEAKPLGYLSLLQRLHPHLATAEFAEKVHTRARKLIGQWRATPFGKSMTIIWNE